MLTACDNRFKYRDNDVNLHDIATNSLLGVSAYESNKIFVVETDDYGRKLFAFEGFTSNATPENGRIFALLVSQKTTETDSYFYDNVNCIFCKFPNLNQYKNIDEEQVKSCFTDEQISTLKSINDWDKPLKKSGMFHIKTTGRKKDYVSDGKLKEAFLMIATVSEYDNSSIVPLTIDKNGKSIYYIRVKPVDSKRGDYKFSKSYIIMFDKNGKVDTLRGIMEIENVWDYRGQLETFKVTNAWNQ